MSRKLNIKKENFLEDRWKEVENYIKKRNFEKAYKAVKCCLAKTHTIKCNGLISGDVKRILRKTL